MGFHRYLMVVILLHFDRRIVGVSAVHVFDCGDLDDTLVTWLDIH